LSIREKWEDDDLVKVYRPQNTKLDVCIGDIRDFLPYPRETFVNQIDAHPIIRRVMYPSESRVVSKSNFVSNYSIVDYRGVPSSHLLVLHVFYLLHSCPARQIEDSNI